MEFGRSTVREALKRWEALGIVEMRQGSGVFLRVAVSPNLLHVPLLLARPSRVKNLLQILQVRRALEGEAAAICASSASADQISAVGAAFLRMEAAQAKGDSSEEDWQFHLAIYHATGNPSFQQLIQSMRDLLLQLWEKALELPICRGFTSLPPHHVRGDCPPRPGCCPCRGMEARRLR